MLFNLIYSSFLYYVTFTIICLLFTSCELENKNTHKRTQFIMGTLIEITVQESNKDLAQKAINKSFDEMSRLEKIMSSYLPDSELSKFNTLAGGKKKNSCLTRSIKSYSARDLLGKTFKWSNRHKHWTSCKIMGI